MKRLNIFIDETGMFEENTSDLYGVSFVFHEQNNSIIYEVRKFNNILKKIGFDGMIHTSNLVRNVDEYKNYSLDDRRKILNSIIQFARNVKAQYHSIIINKKYEKCDNDLLRKKLLKDINEFFVINQSYFKKFDKIVVYYDNGQIELSTLLKDSLSSYINYEQITNFDKKSKRLFQVADMLTFTDKLEYKLINKIKFTNSEKVFFSYKRIKEIIKSLKNKRL